MESKINWSLAEIAALVGGTVGGNSEASISRAVSVEVGEPNGLAFAENEEYLAKAEANGVGAILVPQDIREPSIPHIRVPHPRIAYGIFLSAIEKKPPLEQGIHPMSFVDGRADIHPSASIGAFAVVEQGAKIGPEAKIYPFAYVGVDCEVGEKSIILPHAVLLQDVKVGNNCVIHPGAVLGSSGFGYVWDGTAQRRIPQVGSVKINDHVEIGSNTTVDRAMMGATSIGKGTKIDNLVQVGHNCEIGEHSILAGMVGLAGSTIVGNNVIMGGGVGTRDHVKIADGVILGGRSGVDSDINEPGEYFGTPARPAREAKRNFLLFTKLYEMHRRLNEIDRRTKS
jgi:UDP-3-O-[3-hydroxymyristoyl] glucosamine N-acyltransferase